MLFSESLRTLGSQLAQVGRRRVAAQRAGVGSAAMSVALAAVLYPVWEAKSQPLLPTEEMQCGVV